MEHDSLIEVALNWKGLRFIDYTKKKIDNHEYINFLIKINDKNKKSVSIYYKMIIPTNIYIFIRIIVEFISI